MTKNFTQKKNIVFILLTCLELRATSWAMKSSILLPEGPWGLCGGVWGAGGSPETSSLGLPDAPKAPASGATCRAPWIRFLALDGLSSGWADLCKVCGTAGQVQLGSASVQCFPADWVHQNQKT